MFTILIQEKGGEQRRMVFNKPEVTIGRVQGNDIVLPKGNVSKRHARIVLKDGKFIIVDLKSTNGTYVNGRKITSPLVVKDSDKIYIGDFIVGVDEAASGEGDGVSEVTTPPGIERSAPQDVRPPRPTEAQPMANLPVQMANPDPIAPPAPPAPPPAQRTQPPRQPPGPPPGAPSMAREPAMPPLGVPPESPTRPVMGRPVGGTMPPPMAPAPVASIPAPITAPPPMGGLMFGAPPAPAPAPTPPPTMAPAVMVPPMLAPQAAPTSIVLPMAVSPAPVAMPLGAPAPVVQLAADKGRGRGLVGAGARKVVGRGVSLPSRRAVHLEPLDPKIVKMLDLQAGILERVRAKLDLDKVPFERLQEEELWQRAERAVIDLVESLDTSGELPKYVDQDALIKATLDEALGVGLIDELLADEQIDEILVDRRDRVVVGKAGQLRGSGKAFSSDEAFERVVKRLVAHAGGRLDDTMPIVDLRMADGTRLTAMVAPVASRGACLVLRKPSAAMPTLAELAAPSSHAPALSPGMADFLGTCVSARRNILVCGGPASGKTTILAAIAAAAPAGERVVSIEEVGELAIARDAWIQLETRVGVGKNADIDLATLLESALRLAPDRLIVGEVRGREALPLVHALNAACDGAVVSMSGEGANAALGRLATLASESGGAEGPIRDLVAHAFEIVVHVTRWADGSIRVAAIEEVTGSSEAGFETEALFTFQGGAFAATGKVPRFYGELAARGIPADQTVFR